jgi:hypothetical protein
MTKSKICVLLLFACLVAVWFYASSQRPKVWWNDHTAGVALLKGGYRSWTLQFCDGYTLIDGKMQPVVVDDLKGVRPGHYRWPKFRYCDLRSVTRTE